MMESNRIKKIIGKEMELIRFREFVESKNKIKESIGNTIGKHNDYATSVFLPSNWTGDESMGSMNADPRSVDLEIPTVSRKSKIMTIRKNQNPIVIQMHDGTKIFMTLDEFNRVASKNKMKVGKELTVVFQRREEDKGEEPSKVVKIF